MSYAYGSLVNRAREDAALADAKEETDTNKYVALIAALVPADVLAIHAIVLSLTTTTDDAGTTSITNAGLLGNSFIVLVIVSAALYLLGRGLKEFKPKDLILLVIPPLSFAAWAALIGTSALTPWVAGVISREALLITATILAVLIIAVNAKFKPA